ncbi:MAG: hypothetical protein ABJ327_11190 [Litoreibacter sp.]
MQRQLPPYSLRKDEYGIFQRLTSGNVTLSGAFTGFDPVSGAHVNYVSIISQNFLLPHEIEGRSVPETQCVTEVQPNGVKTQGYKIIVNRTMFRFF